MQLGDIMRTRVVTIGPDDTASKAWTRMRRRGIRHLVVMDGPELVGVISERDLGGRTGADVRRNRTVLRGLMHLGTFGGLVGLREARHYGTGGGEAAIFAPVGVPPPGGPAKEGGQT